MRHGVLAVGGDKLHEGREERGLSHVVGIEPVELGLGKSLGHIAQRRLLDGARFREFVEERSLSVMIMAPGEGGASRRRSNLIELRQPAASITLRSG